MSKFLSKQTDVCESLHLNHELNIRRKKLLLLRKQGFNFPNDFRRSHYSIHLHKKYAKTTNQTLLQLNITVNVAGRIVSQRIMGKASFITLQDKDGCIQLYITSNLLPENSYKNFIKQWDIGDIIGASGTLFKTRTDELSINCHNIKLLTKSLRPLPNKSRGLINQEMKYRQRYLDLITNNKTRKIFKVRSLIISEIRKFMVQRDFMEVETPMMHVIPGGAMARPFITHHNALGKDMYLRIAPELYLKKLVIGGFERIFEINRNFRNEGISSIHNPEFTMMEIYQAYSDYHDMINLIQNLLCILAQKIIKNNIVKYGEYSLNFCDPFTIMTIKEAIHYYLPETQLKNMDDINVAISVAKDLGIFIDDCHTLNTVYMIIFEKAIVHKIIQPTCITSYPIEMSPLAYRNNNNINLADRFELFIAGQEIGNGFSELNDPDDQRMRFLKQIEDKKDNVHNDMYNINYYDEDYLVALEHGLPPTAGVGIGIDRLIMLLTNTHTIRDVILFPTLRSK